MLFIKKLYYRLKLILKNPKDVKYLHSPINISRGGIIVVIHESNPLGTSLLTRSIAEEIINRGEKCFIISRQFGVLNKEYEKICPNMVILSRRRIFKVMRMMNEKYGYKRIILVSSQNGDLARVAKDLGYSVVSQVHEMPYVIDELKSENNVRNMVKYSDKVVFATSTGYEAVCNKVGVYPKTKTILPQGTYLKKVSGERIQEKIDSLKDTYKFDTTKRIIIAVANTSHLKGFDTFVEMAKKSSDYEFLWAGKKERFYESIQEVNSIHNFHYLGLLGQEELAALYSIANVLAVCSRSDNLPSVIFEALMYDVPIIGYKYSGGIVDFVNDNNGYLIENYSTDDFLNAINAVLDIKRNAEMKRYIKENKIDRSFSAYVGELLKLFEE